MRKLVCFCDRCAVAAEWTLRPSNRNVRFFDLTVSCHGEAERFLVAASDLMHARDPSTGRELLSPLYIIAIEGERPSTRVRVIKSVPQNLSSGYTTSRTGLWVKSARIRDRLLRACPP
jgi:hypothetical protein